MKKTYSRPSLIDFLQNFEEHKKLKKEEPQVSLKVSSVLQPIPPPRLNLSPPAPAPPPDIIGINDTIRKMNNLDTLASKYNSYIKDNIFKISVHLENNIFEFVPTNLYLLLANDNYVVCMYNLKMTNITTNAVTESTVPYYISNGKTNQLRGNLLFPFMCFNEETTKDVCPFTNYGGLARGGLFKYEILSNLDTDSIKDSIDSKFDKSYIDSLENISREGSIGITSVISRISNLLDFLICINNNSIINYDVKDIMKYHPIINNNENNELDMSKIEDKSIYNDLSDKYKNELLLVLQKYIISLKKLGIVKFELIDISIDKENIITKSFFNKYKNVPNICKNHKVNEESRENIKRYIDISYELGINFKAELDSRIEAFYDSPENLNFMKEFLKLFKLFVNRDKSLDIQILNWRARCYKKYLKYKKKYLQLKNK
jgi:hypothetical protein